MNTKALKSKILDLAIHGKLVPQNPSYEPATVLLDKIRAEKEAKIKAGQIKREKKDSYIFKNPSDGRHYEKFADGTLNDIEDEIPFEIPESWAWCRLKSISSQIMYGVNESAQETGKYKLLRITDIQDNKVNWKTVPFANCNKQNTDSYLLKQGDIVFARTGATVGKSFLIRAITEQAVFASYLIRVRLHECIYSSYIETYFNSTIYWNQILDSSSGIGQPNVNGTKLSELLIVIPPLEEQKQIVTKIDEIFMLLDIITTKYRG